MDSKSYPDYCRTLTVTDSNGHIKELVFPKALDLDRPKRVRTSFTSDQLQSLEEAFLSNQYMVGKERLALANKLQLTETQVKVWFQNRRTKQKKDQTETSLPPSFLHPSSSEVPSFPPLFSFSPPVFSISSRTSAETPRVSWADTTTGCSKTTAPSSASPKLPQNPPSGILSPLIPPPVLFGHTNSRIHYPFRISGYPLPNEAHRSYPENFYEPTVTNSNGLSHADYWKSDRDNSKVNSLDKR